MIPVAVTHTAGPVCALHDRPRMKVKRLTLRQSSSAKLRDNSALPRDSGTMHKFAGQSRGMRDGWQVWGSYDYTAGRGISTISMATTITGVM